MIRLDTRARRVAFLGALYLVQGLPYGFQAKALPLYLRANGVSLEAIGFATALALPWMLKALWAPLVDRFTLPWLGRRRTWILPMQAGMAVTAGVAMFAPLPEQLGLLMGLIFAMNLFAATQDIAVDGWAVDLLGEADLGPANAAQVVGYKVGMLLSGGLLVWGAGQLAQGVSAASHPALIWLSAGDGFRALFGVMAALIVAVFGLVLATPEAPPPPDAAPPETTRDLLRTLWRALRLPGMGLALLFIATYKIGESIIDVMYKPFLVDAGFSTAQLGLWLGTWGMVASLSGSAVGGWLATRTTLLRAVGLAAVLRVLPELGQVWMAASAGPLDGDGPALAEGAVIGITCAEHFFGGLLTTAMFAWMMKQVDRRIGATHYTLLASVEVFGKAPAAWLSGKLAAAVGYTATFAIGAALGVAYLALLWPLGQREAARRR
ncbi:MAG: MFS transporter [Alphaproteobacteria bacterium]|nr:MFS transporter [Alphaproteobacteria bacterium]